MGLSLDYIAGFFDGEGSFIVKITRDKRYKSGYHIVVKVAIPQKNKEILEMIKDSLGIEANIYFHSRDKLWYLEIYRLNDVKKFVDKVCPRLILKKEKCLRLRKIITLMEKGAHLSPPGIKLIKAAWAAPETGANPR